MESIMKHQQELEEEYSDDQSNGLSQTPSLSDLAIQTETTKVDNKSIPESKKSNTSAGKNKSVKAIDSPKVEKKESNPANNTATNPTPQPNSTTSSGLSSPKQNNSAKASPTSPAQSLSPAQSKSEVKSTPIEIDTNKYAISVSSNSLPSTDHIAALYMNDAELDQFEYFAQTDRAVNTDKPIFQRPLYLTKKNRNPPAKVYSTTEFMIGIYNLASGDKNITAQHLYGSAYFTINQLLNNKDKKLKLGLKNNNEQSVTGEVILSLTPIS